MATTKEPKATPSTLDAELGFDEVAAAAPEVAVADLLPGSLVLVDDGTNAVIGTVPV